MSKIGKISIIPKDVSNGSGIQSMQTSLALKGLTRIPGTGSLKYPYKELDNKYRTGLDPNAAYINRLGSEIEKEIERERVTKLKERLQLSLGDIDLGPRSPFWNHSLARTSDDTNHVQGYKLMDGDNIFDLSVPFMELTFSWLRVHPTIASSLDAYNRGAYPSDTQWYVSDSEMENNMLFQKKETINNAIMKFHQMSPEKRLKIARLLGLPVSENSKPSFVYNAIDSILKKEEFSEGLYKGLSSVTIFNQFADMKDNVITVKDLVKQAIDHSIYRKKPNGRIYEGEYEIAIDEGELVKKLLDDDNQEDLLILESKLAGKKVAMI